MQTKLVRGAVGVLTASAVSILASGCGGADEPQPDTVSDEQYQALTNPISNTPFWTDGIENPAFVAVDAADLDDASEVIGIVVGGEALAFPPARLSSMTGHVVNHVVESDGRNVPLTVTYCDMEDCIRVLSSSTKSGSLKIATVGRSGDELLLQFDGVQFRQSAEEIPLDDIDFERTTFGEWIEAHPETKVYIGPAE